jgi:cobalt-zinc-cadmium efflux system membrane fusion protein
MAAIGAGLMVTGAVLGIGAIEGWIPMPRLPNASAEEPARPSSYPASNKQAVSGGESQITLDEQHMQNVKVEPVELVMFREIKRAIGQVAYNEDKSTSVFSNYTGRVVRIAAKPGDTVKMGDPLFDLYSTDLLANESADIAAVAALNSARSHLELTKHALERAKILYEAKAIALRDYEQAKDDFQAAVSNEVAAAGALDAARHTLRLYGKTDDFIAALETTRRTDPVLPIKSPIDGVVTMRKLGPGQYIAPDNQNPVYAVADRSTMWLRVSVAEIDAPFVHAGQPVEVEVAALPGRVFKAKIVYVAADVDPVIRRVAVRAEVPNTGGLLKPQMFATAQILADRQTADIGVPQNGVQRNGPTASVWVETSQAHFVSRTVKLGLEQNGYVQILSGLKQGERIVSDGAIYLSNALAIAK